MFKWRTKVLMHKNVYIDQKLILLNNFVNKKQIHHPLYFKINYYEK